jgi:hypothetical protein
MKDINISVQRAPEPTDVIWENCTKESKKKHSLRFITV